MQKRSLNGDLIRCIAVICVLSVHFFLNTEFYSAPVDNNRMYLMVIIRTAFMVCVPLFLLLTGYFMCHKTLSKSYYKGIVKTLGIYVLCGIACVIYKAIFIWQGSFPFKKVILSFFSFTAAPYAWYICMYIGLYLLIPFLNGAYHSLKSKKQKQALVLTLLILTCLPTVFNIFNFEAEGWWLKPSLSAQTNALVPDWWISIYPLTYYFIGAYIREFDLKIKKGLNVLLLSGSVLLFGAFNIYMSYGGKFAWGKYNNWGGFENVIMSVLLFVLILHLDLSKAPKFVEKSITKVSELSLGIYLVSYIFDNAVYAELNKYEPSTVNRINYFLIAVPLVFICSLVLSFLINLAYKYLEKLFSAIFSKAKEKTPIYEAEEEEKELLNLKK